MTIVEVIDVFRDGGWAMIVENISEMTGFRERMFFFQMPGGGVVHSVYLGPS